MADPMLVPVPLVSKLNKDLRAVASKLSHQQARYLVDQYYTLQENRIRADAQLRACAEAAEPTDLLGWLGEQNETLEAQIKNALDRYTMGHPIGMWMRSIKGIGPVIAAGFLANIDITKAETAGAIWSFCGQNPMAVWEKGQKRPWNARLKVLCWKLGESFVKVSNRDDDVYGKVYKIRKEYEQAKNEAGDYAEQATTILVKKKISKETDAYRAYIEGRLPPAHIQSRAKRYAVKLFLAHLHEVWRKYEGLPVPLPYSLAILNHAHKINPPEFLVTGDN